MCIGILKLKLILFVQCLLSNLLIIGKIDIPNENLSFLLSLTRAPSCRIYYQAVLGDIAGVMHTCMSQGKSVHIKGLGCFRYVLDTKGVKDLKEFNFGKQVQAVHVQFIPERAKTSNGTYTRALVDSEQLEWIELSPDTKDQDPSGSGGNREDQEENPLG